NGPGPAETTGAALREFIPACPATPAGVLRGGAQEPGDSPHGRRVGPGAGRRRGGVEKARDEAAVLVSPGTELPGVGPEPTERTGAFAVCRDRRAAKGLDHAGVCPRHPGAVVRAHPLATKDGASADQRNRRNADPRERARRGRRRDVVVVAGSTAAQPAEEVARWSGYLVCVLRSER